MTTNVMNTRPDDTNHRLEQAWIARQVWDKDIFVDALYIGSTDTTDDFGMYLFGPLPFLTHLSKEEGKYQESIQSSTTPDPGHHMRN